MGHWIIGRGYGGSGTRPTNCPDCGLRDGVLTVFFGVAPRGRASDVHGRFP